MRPQKLGFILEIILLNSISIDIIIALLETHFDTVYVMHTLSSFYPDNVFNATTEIHIPLLTLLVYLLFGK